MSGGLMVLVHAALLVVATAMFVATLPLVLELMLVSAASFLPVRRTRNGPALLRPVERLVIVVPSHNEELSIAACIESLGASAGSRQDILVIAHNCEDGTAEQARAAGAMVSELTDASLRGKGHALVHGFDLAFRQYGADAVLIVDADSRVSRNLMGRVHETLRRAPVLQCRYDSRAVTDSPKARLRALSFLCMNVVRPTGRQRLGLSCGIFGNGFALRREVLDRVPYAAHSIVEDLEFHLALLAAGIRTTFVSDALVSADVPASAHGMATQSARWEGGRIRMMLARGPSVLGQVLRGKITMIEPLLDLACLPIASGVFLLLLALAVPVPALRLYGAFGCVVVAFHLLAAIRLSPDAGGDLRALVHFPVYVLTKAAMLPAIVRAAGKGTKWVRTARLASEPGEKDR